MHGVLLKGAPASLSCVLPHSRAPAAAPTCLQAPTGLSSFLHQTKSSSTLTLCLPAGPATRCTCRARGAASSTTCASPPKCLPAMHQQDRSAWEERRGWRGSGGDGGLGWRGPLVNAFGGCWQLHASGAGGVCEFEFGVAGGLTHTHQGDGPGLRPECRLHPVAYLSRVEAQVVSLYRPPAAAPGLQALVSVSTIGTLDDLSEQQLIDAVKAELAPWFGAGEVGGWRHLKTYRIPFAQPNQVGSGAGGCLAGKCGCGWEREAYRLD